MHNIAVSHSKNWRFITIYERICYINTTFIMSVVLESVEKLESMLIVLMSSC